MDAFPAFIPLAGRTVVVIGEGEPADAKARLFDGAPCHLLRLAGSGVTPSLLADAVLIFIGLPDGPELDHALAVARATAALVNVVDRPELCDFATPSIVDRGMVVGAIGTGGSAPVLATRLRQQLEALWPARLGELARLLKDAQGAIRGRFPDLVRRRAFLRAALDGRPAELALAGDTDGAAAALTRALDDASETRVGGVWLLSVGTSPDDLTLGDLRRLGAADRVVVKGPVSESVLAFARRDAPRTVAASDSDLADWVAAGEQVAVLEAR